MAAAAECNGQTPHGRLRLRRPVAAPAVTLTVLQSPTSDPTPLVRATASDLNGIPDGTPVVLDVDLNNDGDFLDPGELSYTVPAGGLVGGFVQFEVSPALAAGSYTEVTRVFPVGRFFKPSGRITNPSYKKKPKAGSISAPRPGRGPRLQRGPRHRAAAGDRRHQPPPDRGRARAKTGRQPGSPSRQRIAAGNEVRNQNGSVARFWLLTSVG
jgi:hypothetical protein